MRIQWTIRRRLLSLVISVALPLVIMILLNGTAETLDARQRSQSQLLQLARAIARQLDLLIEDERLPVDTAALDTAHLQEKARIDFLPPQYVLTIVEPQGGVVFRSADSDRWIGQDVDDAALVRQVAQAPEGVAEMADLDGVPRLHGYATTSTAGWRVLVSAPPAVAYAQVWNVIGRNSLLSVAVVIVALLMARLIMRRIDPPLQALIAGARAVSAGDDDVQVEPAPDRDLADLATAFNQIVARRREATTQLEQAAARYRELFENSRDALFVIDLDGRTIDANAAATRLTGYRLDELRDNRVLDLMPLDAKERSEARAARYRQAQGMRELILVTRDGRQVPVEVAVTPIAYEGRTALLGAARDISERRESEERLVRLSQRILTLNEAGLRMQETFDPEAILQIVGEELGRQRFSCLLAFLSDDQQSAQVRYVSEPDWLSLFRETTGLELIGFTFPLTGAAAQRLIREQHTFMEENVRPLLEAGLPPDARPAARDMFIRLRLTRVIVAPLVVDRRVTALLIVARHDLQEVDTPAIAAFASQAAVTLENARLYAEATQKTEEVAALNEIAAIVSRSLDLPAVLDAVLTQLGRVVEYDSASVFLDNGRSLAVVAARGYPRLEDVPSSPIPRGDNLYQRLLSIREPLIMSGADLSAHPALAPRAGPAWSWLGVPLLALGELIGILSIERRWPGEFTSEHARRAKAFAQIAASAIENARLFDRERRALNELSALAGITEVGLSVLHPDELLQELIRRVVKSTGAAAGMIMLLDGDRLVTRAAVGLDPGVIGYTQRLGQGFSGRIAATARSLIITDAETDPLVENPSLKAAHIKTILGVPLKAGEEVIGVAHIDFTSVRSIEATEIARFEVMADRAARAMENARLYERVRAYAEDLEQRVAERTRDLERASAKAQEADKLKSQLLSIVSHELRTPLASIKGYVTTLIDYRDRLQDATQEEFLAIIDSESDRLRELVENLLDMSRIEAGVLHIHPEPVPLQPVINQALTTLQPKLAGREVGLDLLEALPEVVIDAGRVRQVISNLIDNAAKYSPQGTPIRISVSVGETHVTVGVHDCGPGISPEHEQRIFERFYRIADARIRNTGGIGLGLAISRALIEAHGGRLWLRSEVGQGSAFYFSVPIAPDEPRVEAGDEAIQPVGVA